jgi:hypothetical protein
MIGARQERWFAHLVAALQGIDGSAVADAAVASNAVLGATSLEVADGSSYVTGKPCLIDADGDREEITPPVASINTNILTFQTTPYWAGLAYAHTLTQADEVKQDWYNYALDRVDTWQPGGIPLAKSPFPSGTAVILGESIDAYETGHQIVMTGFEVALWWASETSEPIDQTNDSVYRKLIADSEKAIFDDWTRGGHAITTRILSRRPLDQDDAGDLAKDIPLVGALLNGQVEWRQRTGDQYS